MSVNIAQLWLPILLGGLLSWIASGVIHMVIKYHNADYKKLANEDDISAALGKESPAPGIYTLPHCVDMSEMGSEAMQKKFNDGPVAFVTVFASGMPNMGKLMVQQVSYGVIACVLIALSATLALPAGAAYMSVFQFVAIVGFMTFGWATVPYSIWYGHPWATTGRFLLDALIYALLVAGVFGWLWPGAA